MVMTIQAYAARKADGKLKPFKYQLGSLKPDEVEIDVEYCGICYNDLHMLRNEWRITRYPFLAGLDHWQGICTYRYGKPY